MIKNDIQKYPTSDSINNDAFEGIVELYYELEGFITSSGKWFWKKFEGKQQRGYQDIDVLAINGKETIIVSVSSNFDDKLNFSKNELNLEKALKTVEYYKRVEEYLKETPEYNWLLTTTREIKRVLAVINTPKNILKFNDFLNDNNIEVLTVDNMITKIFEYLNNPHGFKIQNQTLRILQILKEKKRIDK